MPDYSKRNKGLRFCGAKGKCGEVIAVINEYVRFGCYWEPFVGSGKVIAEVRCPDRFGSDTDPNIILLLRAVQNGWVPPDDISESEYKEIQAQAKEGETSALIGFVGYGCSFGARFMQGYARSGNTNFARTAKAALLRQRPFLKGVRFAIRDYRSPFWSDRHRTGVIYCDPPYENTKRVGGMKKPFDTAAFWAWAWEKSQTWTVLVSEYACPLDERRYEVVWQRKVAAGLRYGTGGDGGNKGTGERKPEKLFLLNPNTRRHFYTGSFLR